MRPISSHWPTWHGRGRFVAILLALALVVGTPAPALAHADLVEATPAPNAVLDAPPERVTARFGEPVAPAFSAITVLDAAGERVDAGEATVDADDPTRMSLALPPLGDGTYTVSWRNVSSVDGHALRGWYVFSVGEPIDGAVTGAGEQPVLTSPFDPVVRWLALLGALAIVGGVTFDRAVARPALDRLRADGATARLREAHRRWIGRLLVGGLLLWTLGTLLQLPVQLSVATGEPLHRAGVEAAGALLGGTDWGRAWLLRVTLLAASAGLLWRWRSGGGTTALLLVTGGALFAMSLASHGATLTTLRPIGLSTDFLHLLAASLWVGGLFALVTLVHHARRTLTGADLRWFLRSLLPRFSVVAVLSVVTLAVTGMVLAWLHVQEPAALDSPYGRVLLAKTLLFLSMLALAAVNLLWTTREAGRSERGARWLGRLVGAEAVVAVLVILAVAAMTSMQPARLVDRASPALVETASDVTVTLRADPGDVGSNRLSIRLEDRLGQPVTAHHVAVQVSYAEAEIGDLVKVAQFREPGRYEVDGIPLGSRGDWSIDIVAPRTDGFDVRASFLLPIGPAVGAASAALPVQTARWIWIAQWLALGALCHGVAWRLRGSRRRATTALQWTGVTCFAAVILVALNLTPFRMDESPAGPQAATARAESLRPSPETYTQEPPGETSPSNR